MPDRICPYCNGNGTLPPSAANLPASVSATDVLTDAQIEQLTAEIQRKLLDQAKRGKDDDA